MFDPDKAIKSWKDDELSRFKFAKSLGDAILSYEYKYSLVIGLLGKWGYGKTSIINMATEHIAEITKDDENPPIMIEFNPWIFSNQNQLIKKFFDELSVKINDDDVKKGLKSYVNKLIPPIIGLASIIDPVRTQALIKNAEYFDDILSEEESLESIKNELNNLIGKKNQKIIVVIDDIDRLNDFEIQQIFQLVKLLADFPNTIYLLSFDRQVVINALEKVQRSSGENYLEKVIQIPFEVPKINESDLERLLFNQIKKVIDENAPNFDRRRWLNIYYYSLKYFFNNVRDINRYINSLKFEFPLIKDEVNVADFMAITAIHVFLPELYYGIRDNKDLYSGLSFFSISGTRNSTERNYAKERCEEIIRRVNGPSPKGLRNLLTFLFPKLQSIYNVNINLHESYLNTWRKNMQISSPEYFDTYFRFSILENEIPKVELDLILSKAENLESFKEALMNLNKNKKIGQFLKRIIDYLDDIPPNNIKNVVLSLIELGDDFPEGSGFGSDSASRISWIVDSLLKRLDRKERFIILKNAFLKSNSLHTIIGILHDIDYEYQKHNDSDIPIEFNKDLIISKKELNELKNSTCDKIEFYAKEGQLSKRNLRYILYFWQKCGREKEVTKFINEFINTDSGLIDFITGFVGKYRSQGGGDPIPRTFLHMNFESMSNFIDPQELKPRVKSIASSSLYQRLNENNKDAIDLFLENKDKIEINE